MPGTIEADGCGASASPQPNPSSGSRTREAPITLKSRCRDFSSSPAGVHLAVVATIALWATSAVTWTLLCLRVDRTDAGLGWDLVTSWRAERAFARGAQPYLLGATDHRLYLYPPSALLVLRPLAALSLHEVQVLGLVATAVMSWAAVMISASVLGRRWWGLTAAVVVFALSWAEPLVAELGLENVTVVCTLALAAFYLLTARGRWMPAGIAIGLTLAVKPLLLAVLLVFVLARKWRALAVTIAIPAVLNAAAFVVVRDPGAVFAKLPSLLNRTGTGALLNSAWVDVMASLGAPDLVTILVRIVTLGAVIVSVWWSWEQIDDSVLSRITITSMLLIGTYLAGTLSENHFMLTLVPLAMTAVIPGSPMRWPSAWVGLLLLMGLTPPGSLLGLNSAANLSVFRAFGMSLVVLSVLAALGSRRAGRRHAARALGIAPGSALPAGGTPGSDSVTGTGPAPLEGVMAP